MNRVAIFVLRIPAFADVDIRLLTNSNLTQDFFYVPSLHEDTQREIVISHVRQCIAAVVFARVEDQLVLETKLEQFERVRPL